MPIFSHLFNGTLLYKGQETLKILALFLSINLKSESVETVIPCMVTYKVPLLPYSVQRG